MKIATMMRGGLFAILSVAVAAGTAHAHKLRGKGETVTVADSTLTVTPGRNWNRLDMKMGKNTETWTLDGEQLNEVTFFAGIEAGKALVREADKKREPLPKFTTDTLLVEVPELFEKTYRTCREIKAFQIVSTEPGKVFGQDGVFFAYEYTDANLLTRKGEARAAIVGGKLYMMTFDAPRLYYHDRAVEDFRALAGTANL